MSRRLLVHGLVWVSMLASCSVSASALAQVSADQKAAAEALFDKGLELMKQGDYARACSYLEQSQAVERGIGTMLYLADCYEHIGRTASAWALFREAASAAQAEGQAERAAAGAARAQQLEPQLAKLVLVVPAGARVPGLEILRNGTPVPSAVWGLAVPVDPGAQALEVRAPGHASWSHSESIARGAQITLTIPPLAALDPAPVPAAPAAALVPGAVDTPGAAPVDREPGSLQRTAAFITGGAGLVSLVVGTYFGVRAVSKNSDAKQLCPEEEDFCASRAGVELSAKAQDAATLSNVFVIGGAALAATGIVLYLTAPDDSGPVVAVKTTLAGAELSIGGRL